MDESYLDMLAQLKDMRKKATEGNLVYQKKYKEYYDKAKKTAEQTIKAQDWIWIENTHKQGANPKFHPAFLGPYKVIEVEGLNVRYEAGKKQKVAHMNRVKPARVPKGFKQDESCALAK